MVIFGYEFGIVDLIIIGMILLFAIVGLAKGFLKQVLSMANGLVSIVVSSFLVSTVTKALSNTSLALKLNEKILTLIVDKYPNSALIETNLITTKEELVNAFSESGLSKFLSKITAEFIDITSFSDGEMLADAVSKSVGYFVLSIIIFVLLALIVFIVIKILISILDSIAKEGILNVINRILGLLLGVARALLIVCICLFIVSLLVKFIEPLNTFIVDDLKLETEGFGIGKYLYENNPLIILWNLIFNKVK